MRLQKAINDFLRDEELSGASPHTVDAHRIDLNLLMRGVKGRDAVSAFTEELARDLMRRTAEAGAGPLTLRRRLSSARAFARWGITQRLWLADPTASIKRPRAPDRIPRPFEAEERSRLLALTLPMQESAFRGLLYYTGMRVGSILSLRVKDIQLGDGRRPGTVRAMGKGKKEHIVAIVPELAEILKDYYLSVARLDKPMGALFAWRTGQPWDRGKAARVTHEWGKAADVPKCTPHRFRHDFATRLLEAGVRIEDVSKLLNHADIGTTMIYTRVSNQRLTDAIMRLSKRPDMCTGYSDQPVSAPEVPDSQ